MKQQWCITTIKNVNVSITCHFNMTLKVSLYAHKQNISRWIHGSDVMNNLVRELKRRTARHVHSKDLTSSNQVHL